MAYERYVPEFTDKNGNVYGVMDAEVREEVSDLNSAFDNNVKSKIELVTGTWQSSGAIFSSVSRGSSKLIYDIQEYSKITFPTGYEGRIFYWDENMSNGHDTSFAQSIDLTAYYERCRYFAIVVRDSADTAADISGILSTISNGIILEKTAYTAYDKSNDSLNLSLSIKNIGVLFESGTFGADGTGKAENNTRIRTVEPIDLSKVSTLTMPTGFELSAYMLDGSKVKMSQTSYLSTINFLEVEPTAKYANVFIKKTDSATSDISSYVLTVNLGVTVTGTEETDDTAVTLPFSDFVPDLHIYKTEDGYTTDFVPQEKYIRIENGVTVFMASDGDDTNDGLSVLTPKKTLESALAISNVQTIIILEGTYVAGTHFTAGRRVTQPVNIVGIGNVVLDNGSGAPITFARNLYCENIHFKHGNDNTVIWDAYAEDSIAVFYNCEFSDSYALNGVRLFGGTAYVVDCVCHDNAYDGFNYHNKNTWPNKTVEINCKSYNNGKIDLAVAEGNTSNATTIHGDCIIVRVNGDYKACHGAIVADQGKYSANYGCRAGLSTITDSNYDTRKANYWATHTVEMWLYDCTSYGSKYDTYHDSTAILHSDRVYPSMI